jgi:hypothetical protein
VKVIMSGIGELWRVAVAVASTEFAEALLQHERTGRDDTRGVERWLPCLVHVGHPDAVSLIRQALQGASFPGGHFGATLHAAMLRPDASYLPALAELPSSPEVVQVVAAIPGDEATRVLRDWALKVRLSADVEESAAAHWLKREPEAATEWLLEQSKRGDEETRAVALRLLARAGDQSIASALFSQVQYAKRGTVRRHHLLHALAHLVRQHPDPGLRKKAANYGRDFTSADMALLEAIHELEPEVLERRLLKDLSCVPDPPQPAHVEIVGSLGRIGGEKSLEILVEWTERRLPRKGSSVYDMHLVAREAVGKIERRLGR